MKSIVCCKIKFTPDPEKKLFSPKFVVIERIYETADGIIRPSKIVRWWV